jgi:aromatic ring-opening dioxygenase catalytic subunit (LigB family)
MTRRKVSAVFLSHGAGPAAFLDYPIHHPLHSFDKSSPLAEFLRNISHYVCGKVRNILVISGHWEEKQFTIGYQKNGTTIYYDYGGFPKEAFPPYCSTDLVLANRVQRLLTTAGIPCGKKDRGFDHGVFCPIKAAYPEGDIPVVQLSMKKGLSVAEHIRLGEVLAPLRAEGTLIIGSGAMTHAMDATRQQGQEFSDWFNVIFNSATESNYEQTKTRLLSAEIDCPHLHALHPTTDHLIPLFVAFGSTIPTTVSPGATDQQVSATVSGDKSCVTNTPPKIRSVFSEFILGTALMDNYVFDL